MSRSMDAIRPENNVSPITRRTNRRSSTMQIAYIRRQTLSLLTCVLLAATQVHCQPNFDECKIFLVASDTARDMTLNRDPEYIRFLNLIGGSYRLPFEFDAYDTLPAMLQAIFQSYAQTKYYEIDISAAMFGADVTYEQIDVLEGFCNETSEGIASLVEPDKTSAPTFSPATATPGVGRTQAPTFATMTLDEDLLTMVLGAALTSDVSDLPIQCRRGLFGSDTERDGFLTTTEYTVFVNRMSSNAYSHAATFEDLPLEMQQSFDRLADGGKIDVFGAIPSQWSEATPQQRAFLQLICYRTEAALAAAHDANNNQTAATVASTTVSPTLPQNQTVAPTIIQSATSNTTSPPNNTTSPPNATIPSGDGKGNSYDDSSDDSRAKLGRSAVAAIVGSILLVALGVYLARDKQDRVKDFCSDTLNNLKNFCSNASNGLKKSRRQQKNGKIWPARSNDTGFTTGLDSNDDEPHHPPDLRRQYGLYDLEALQHERTGFLEDHRVGTNALDFNDNDETPAPPRTTSHEFETIRFNPDDFTTRPYENGSYPIRFNPDDFMPDSNEIYDDEEEDASSRNRHHGVINEDFEDYNFDDIGHFSEDDSSAMSLYCSSVAEEEHRPVKGSSPRSRADKHLLGKVETTPGGDPNEYPPAISSPRRGSSTLYHANRFGQIASSESKTDSPRYARPNGETRPSPTRARRMISDRSKNLGGSSHDQKLGTSNHQKLITPRRESRPLPPSKRRSSKIAKRRAVSNRPSHIRRKLPEDVSHNQHEANASAKQDEVVMPISPRDQKYQDPSRTPSRAAHFQLEKKSTHPWLRYARDEPSTKSHEYPDEDAVEGDAIGTIPTSIVPAMEDESEHPRRTRSVPINLDLVDMEDESELVPMDDESKFPHRTRTIPLDRDLVTDTVHASGRQGTHHCFPVPPPKKPLQEYTTASKHSDSYVDVENPVDDGTMDLKGEVQKLDCQSHSNKNGDSTLASKFLKSYLNDDQKQGAYPTLRKGTSRNAPWNRKSFDLEATPLIDDDTVSVSSGSAFHPHSPGRSITKAIVDGGNDSTYYGTASETSSTFPPDSSSSDSFAIQRDELPSLRASLLARPQGSKASNMNTNGATTASMVTAETKDAIREIGELITTLMPTEKEKITQMLAQYQGREAVLLQTLRRLEARSSARGGFNSAISYSLNLKEPRSSAADAKEFLRRSSVLTENAELLAAAVLGVSEHAGMRQWKTGSERSEKTMLDLDSSSEGEVDDDEYSQDSTYVDEKSGDDDGSWSAVSSLR